MCAIHSSRGPEVQEQVTVSCCDITRSKGVGERKGTHTCGREEGTKSQTVCNHTVLRELAQAREKSHSCLSEASLLRLLPWQRECHQGQATFTLVIYLICKYFNLASVHVKSKIG